ncbi:MAG: hypothetical protein N3F64_03645, partial [Nitrososphaeria archaeon]|nr:hypothetical protein [Nitrososphaeria archaeon]
DEGRLILSLIEEAEYDLKKVKSLVDEKVLLLEKRLEQIKFMDDKEFLEYVSRTIFGIASKEYYVSKISSEIEMLNNTMKRIEYYLRLGKENRPLFNYLLRRSFKGNVRRAKKVFNRLAENTFTKKLDSY